VTCNEDDTDGRARVTRDEERVWHHKHSTSLLQLVNSVCILFVHKYLTTRCCCHHIGCDLTLPRNVAGEKLWWKFRITATGNLAFKAVFSLLSKRRSFTVIVQCVYITVTHAAHEFKNTKTTVSFFTYFQSDWDSADELCCHDGMQVKVNDWFVCEHLVTVIRPILSLRAVPVKQSSLTISHHLSYGPPVTRTQDKGD